ncbi:MAG: GntR family transcriptional regulator [Polyangiales bacterium]
MNPKRTRTPSRSTPRDPNTEAAPLPTNDPELAARAVDYVFDILSSAILTGELVAGNVMPQRDLARGFEVPLATVQAALERLERLGILQVLVENEAIEVLDPRHRVQARAQRRGNGKPEPLRAGLEARALLPLPILALAERRLTIEALRSLEKLIKALPEQPERTQARAFRLAFWTQLAEATGDPRLQHQTSWWASLVRELEERRSPDARAAQWVDSTPPVTRSMYYEVLRAFFRRRGAVRAWVSILEHLEARDQRAAHDGTPANTAHNH